MSLEVICHPGAQLVCGFHNRGRIENNRWLEPSGIDQERGRLDD
jgi:hypothetical protein